MRASSPVTRLDIRPGGSGEIPIDVVNTGSVIDGVTARVVGLPASQVTTRPGVLPLFPDAAGQLTVTIELPTSFPAGTHAMTVELLSRQADTEPAYVNVDVVVPQQPKFGLQARPEVVRARRTGRFIAAVTNRGNVPLDIELEVIDPAKRCSVQIEPSSMTLLPGSATEAVATVKAGYLFLGNDTDRRLTLNGAGRAAGAEPAVAPDDAAPEGTDANRLHERVPVTFRQRPLLTRGMLTAIILVAIVALWAAVFLFGLSKVFASDPLTKSAPASFFAATEEDDGTAVADGGAAAADGGAGDGTTDGASGAPGSPGAPGSSDAPDAAAPPAGALPKSGALPAGVGGTIAGTATAASSGDPVGRIMVEALRVRADGSTEAVASAATQADGGYQVAGLFPGEYLLRLSAPGFVTSYYPAAADESGAEKVKVGADAVTSDTNAVVTGLPASITGTVDPGDTTSPVETVVSARMLQQGDVEPVIVPDATAVLEGDSYTFTLANLPAPGTYELTFTTEGYTTTSVRSFVTGGADRFEPTVVLSSGEAQIRGVVTDGSQPLGGVTVTTSVDGEEVATATPTTGEVGRFVIGRLPTPATYVVTVAKEGYGTFSQVVDLVPGQPLPDLEFVLRPGTGVVTGLVTNTAGAGLGGVEVTVGGMTAPPSTITVTDGVIGSFRLAGLPAPGTYTLTLTRDGYAPQTVPVTLDGIEAPPPIAAVMVPAAGTITGTVTGPGGTGLADAAVAATDGLQVWPVSTTSASGQSAAGRYTIADLPPGIYTVTATRADGFALTSRVRVSAGGSVRLNFPLVEAG